MEVEDFRKKKVSKRIWTYMGFNELFSLAKA